METQLDIDEFVEVDEEAEAEPTETISDILDSAENITTQVTEFKEAEETTAVTYDLYYAEKLYNIENGIKLQCGLLLFFFIALIFICLYRFTRSLF